MDKVDKFFEMFNKLDGEIIDGIKISKEKLNEHYLNKVEEYESEREYYSYQKALEIAQTLGKSIKELTKENNENNELYY